jgi:hypothetical protein
MVPLNTNIYAIAGKGGKNEINGVKIFPGMDHRTTGRITRSEDAATILYCHIHDNRSYGIDFASTGLDENVKNNTFINSHHS